MATFIKTWSRLKKLKSINFEHKYSKFTEHWSSKNIVQMNDYHFKIVKFPGEFIWHCHDDAGEVFIVLDGEMSIAFRDCSVDLKSGEMSVAPKGTEHKPFADKESKAILVWPAGKIYTGDAGCEMTADGDVWI